MAGDESVCPHCQFAPRDTGLKAAIGLLAGAVTSIMLAMVSIPLAPTIGPYLVFAGFFLLAVAALVFLLAFLATPSRFSTIRRDE